MTAFPEQFRERMERMLGDEYEAFVKSYDKPFHNGLRINMLKVEPKALLERMGLNLKPVPWNGTGFYLENKKQFSKHPYYHAGLYYIQEVSAMLPARLADARPGERILDMCAAPGGKSTAMAAAMKGEGLLVSNDISRSRAKALLRNLEGFGVTNSIVVSEYPEKLTRYFPEFFDKVLIDAPCSGEGMFHKEPSMTESWLKTGPEAYHKLQKEILASGAKMVKPGGRLIYSTCTFSPEEDEGSIAWFLKEYPDFHLVDVDLERSFEGGCIDRGNPQWADGNEDLALTMRLWPHHLEGEGHFAAVLCRDGGDETPVCRDCGNEILLCRDGGDETLQNIASGKKSENRQRKNRRFNQSGGRASARREKGVSEKDVFYQFLSDEGIHYPFKEERLLIKNGYVQYVPEIMPQLQGLHIMRSGWFLGEIKKQRFEPGGAFARGLTPEYCDKVINYGADSEEVIKYLKCETLQVDDSLANGWYLICVDGFALGWGKISGGTLKNKYPSGWRLV